MNVVIRRPKEEELYFCQDAKWVVENKKCKSCDLCRSLSSAIRFWLWNIGVPPKIAFKTWKRN